MPLASNNRQRLTCHKNQPAKQPNKRIKIDLALNNQKWLICPKNQTKLSNKYKVYIIGQSDEEEENQEIGCHRYIGVGGMWV